MMSDPSGWIWAFLGIVGVGGLGVAIAYAINQWRHRRKDLASRIETERATREVYRQDELTNP
jgi:hypothetical protein